MTSLSAHKMQCNSQRMVWEPLKGQEIKIISITKYCWVTGLLPLILSNYNVELSINYKVHAITANRCRHSSTAIYINSNTIEMPKTESPFLFYQKYFILLKIVLMLITCFILYTLNIIFRVKIGIRVNYDLNKSIFTILSFLKYSKY